MDTIKHLATPDKSLNHETQLLRDAYTHGPRAHIAGREISQTQRVLRVECRLSMLGITIMIWESIPNNSTDRMIKADFRCVA